jgi:L-ectoine synthase
VLIRTLEELARSDRSVAWGNGVSRRFLLEKDGCGISVTDTLIDAASESHLCYEQHAEICYCIEGDGEIERDGEVHPLRPGTLYVLDRGEAHVLRAFTRLRLVCVFSPALVGPERHEFVDGVPSSY